MWGGGRLPPSTADEPDSEHAGGNQEPEHDHPEGEGVPGSRYGVVGGSH